MKAVNIGIDLGTTNSLIAKFENSKVQVYKNPIGQKDTLASVVAFRPDRILIGDKAREYLTKDAVNVFGGFKRKMGTDEKYYVVNLDENVTPIELSTHVLKELKKFLPPTESTEAVVITIPASFDSMQSNATLKAGKDAGFKEVFLLQEPIAACLAFFNANTNHAKTDGYRLVYDLGGGTFDVALVKSTQDDIKIIDHEGNNFLGGVDFDFAIIDEIVVPAIIQQTGITDFEAEFRVKYGKYEMLYYQVMYYAEEAKKELSFVPSTNIEFTAELNGQSYDFCIPITKDQLDLIFQPLVDQTIKLLKSVVEKNKLTSTDIIEIILVGGSTYLSQVREQLATQTHISINYTIDPTNSVAIGAAYYASNKYYEPATVVSEEISDVLLDDLIASVESTAPSLQIETNYSRSSRDTEEVLLISCNGNFDNKTYRIIRTDGGFDTGFVMLKSKKTEFLSLLPGINNIFHFTVYDSNNIELTYLKKEIIITQGMFNIDGQPLPLDICIEVDDLENKTTKLEAIFQKNSLLPQKRTLYREISKTIRKGSTDAIVISILEGDKNARPSSNQTIGYIEITGKDLQSDLIKGSDIEIQIHLTDSRVLNTTVFLVMTQQEFKNVFSISEKVINVTRLKEQYFILENELVETIRSFQYNEDTIWEIKANGLLDELKSVEKKLNKLNENDKSDEKYLIAEKLARISQEYDKLGGDERIALLIEDYFHYKDHVIENIKIADFEKEEMKKEFQKLEQSEASFINSKNVSVLENKIKQLNELNWKAHSNNISFLIAKFNEFKSLTEVDYENYSGAKSIMKMADKALENESYLEFRKHVYNLSSLIKKYKFNNNTNNFNGTGIG